MRILFDKLNIIFRHGFLVFVSLLVIVTGFMIFYPFNPMEVREILVPQRTVAQGEKLCFQFVGEKHMAITANAVVELVNGEAIEVMKYSSNNPVGEVFRQRCFIVPYTVPVDKYSIRWTGTYHVNGLRSIVRSYETKKEIYVIEETKFKKASK
jgi:hypothetical protein